MFATFKSLIPEPRQADEPRQYVGRHRRDEPVPPVPVSPAPILTPAEEKAGDKAGERAGDKAGEKAAERAAEPV